MGMTKNLLAAGIFAALPAMGSAATLSVDGGANFVLPVDGANGGYNPDPAVPGVVAGNTVVNFSGLTFVGGLMLDGPAKLTFTYMGKEASFSNSAVSLAIGGGELSDVAAGAFITFTQLVDGLVQFKFKTDGNGGHEISNAFSTSTSASLDMAFKKITDTSYYAFFGDGGGNNDNDLDDMIIRIDATPVPVPIPAAGFLLAGALGGLVALRRRKTV